MAKKTPETNAKTDVKMQGELSKPEVSAVSPSDNNQSKKNNAKPDSKNNKNSKNSKKEADKKPNIFQKMWKGIKGIISELKKVTWPKGKTVVKSTGVVLAVVVVFFIVLFGIDYVLSGILSLIVSGEWATLFI